MMGPPMGRQAKPNRVLVSRTGGSDSCGTGTARFYDCDGTASSPRRLGGRSISGPTGTGRLAVGVPPLLHRPGLEPYPGSAGRSGAGAWQTHGDAGIAGDGAGRTAELSSLP